MHPDSGSRLPYGRDSKRDLSNVFFDCTNYYSEIDIPSGDKQKGPSKENMHSPIIGQALLLDADLIPVSMQITKNINSFFCKKKEVLQFANTPSF